MRLEPVFNGANGGSRCAPPTLRRTLFCNLHRPVETATNGAAGSAGFTYKLNGCLKMDKKSSQTPSAEDSAIARAFTTSLHIPPKK